MCAQMKVFCTYAVWAPQILMQAAYDDLEWLHSQQHVVQWAERCVNAGIAPCCLLGVYSLSRAAVSVRCAWAEHTSRPGRSWTGYRHTMQRRIFPWTHRPRCRPGVSCVWTFSPQQPSSARVADSLSHLLLATSLCEKYSLPRHPLVNA
jgi:hypothetical protein